MIPDFPQFKNIELLDKKEVEEFTSKFPPYSDFNFFSMWGWNIYHKTRISKLHGNLVVDFNDYVSGDNFLSFIGDNKIKETISMLITYSEDNYNKNFLRLVPEEIFISFKEPNFVIEYERDAFDYVYLTSDLVDMHKWESHSSANKIKNFISMYPKYEVKSFSHKEVAHEEYKKLFHKWAENKHITNSLELNEYKAFERFLSINTETIRIISIHVNQQLVGFSVYEVVSPDHAVAHFSKADVKYHSAIYDVLNWEEAKVFNKMGIKYLNWEQDLGIPGIRFSKIKYRPAFVFKKITVSRK